MTKMQDILAYANSPATQESDARKAEAFKTMPVWQQFGFGSEEQYNNIYNPTANPAPAAPPPTTPGDPFGDYLRNNPGARDAWAYLEALLDEYGLSDLSGFVQENIIEGRSDAEIQQRLRETDTYKKRFAAIEERKKLGLPAMSETEVVQWEKAVTQIYRRADLPAGLFDSPDDFVAMLKNDWSVAEVEHVINQGYVDAQNADPMVRSEIERMFGPGTLTAFFIDPDRTEAKVMAEYQAAKLGAQARFTGYGQLARNEAQELAGLGITEEQARSGFGTLAQDRELFTALPGQEGGIDRNTQLAAAFRGDAGAQQQIENEGRRRVARFQDGGGFSTGEQGFTGLGTAR